MCGGREKLMNYKETQRMIENSSWFKELLERDVPAAKLVKLSRFRFEEELQTVIDRHARQQVRIDNLKKSCHIKP